MFFRRQVPRLLRFSSSYRRSSPSFTVDARKLEITIPALKSTVSYPWLWLRDACPDCVDSSTSQKLLYTADIPLDIRPVPSGVNLSDSGILSINWSDGHTSHFPLSFLQYHASLSRATAAGNASVFHKDVDPEPWDYSTISKTEHLFVEYASLDTPSGLLTAIDHICRYGLIFIVSTSAVSHPERCSKSCYLSARCPQL